jgi:hypothetical protein
MQTFAKRLKPAPDARSADCARRGGAYSGFGGAASRIPAHAEAPALQFSSPADAHEREADRWAERVIRMAEVPLPRASPFGDGCPSWQSERAALEPAGLFAASDSGTTEAPAIVRDVLSSSGQPIAPSVRAFMEPRFGHDFSRVRVHADRGAAASAAALGAEAYTVGSHIVFGGGARSPHVAEGRHLLAHELTHVLQQTGAAQGSLPGQPGGLVTRDRSGRIARQPKSAGSPQPAASPGLTELNGWPMDSILARLNELAEAPLLALINEAKTVKGLNAPRLQLALDVVWTKKFSRATLPEFEAILPSRMESIIPALENADQQAAIKKFLIRARPAKPKDTSALAEPLGAGDKPIASSQLKAFGTDEQTAFKKQVYEAHIAAAARVRKFSMGVAATDLVSIGAGHQLRKDAAPDMISLLAKANEDLKTAQDAGDALAQTVKSIGIGSSYRDTKRDFGLWDQYFEQYYNATQKTREAADGGEHGARAVAIMVAHYTGSKAAPGFSNHTSGIAVDFTTTEGKEALGSNKSQNARWKTSWLHKWLVDNAAKYNYEPLATEAFHWSHKIAEPPPPEPGHTEAGAA